MPRRRISMRKIREVLRLKFEHGLSDRKIAQSCRISRRSVAEYIRRAKAAGISWDRAKDMDDVTLEKLLCPGGSGAKQEGRPVPDWSYVHSELKRRGVTLSLLWQEYKEANPDGYQYSWFCREYGRWLSKADVVMRQSHRGGEKLFVDYAGQTVPVIDGNTGEVREAQIFVAVMGASNYTYVEATWSQSLVDWIGSHVRAFSFFGGVPEVIVPDNLRSGVTKANFYDPEINPTYEEMAGHYGTVVLPTRVRRPRDKAKVEAGVRIVEQWILARLRNHTFFSLDELNRKIKELLDYLNKRPFQKLPGSRKSMFESLDAPLLKSLPRVPYEFAEWKKVKVSIDYHVEVGGHYYSVPYRLYRKRVEVRYTAKTVEIFYKNKRVASHVRSHQKGRHTTVKEHMPASHKRYSEWSPERFLKWAEKIGPHLRELTEIILTSRPYPEQAYRTLLGIFRLGEIYSNERLEAAAKRAIYIGAKSYKSIESILKNNLDQRPLPGASEPDPTIIHANIRGPEYYHVEQERR